MKKHFVTVKISFLTFLRHCIKQYPSIRFCAVSMADQAVSAFLSKDRLQKKFAENIVVKRKRKQLLKNIRCDQKLIPDAVLIWMNKMSCIRWQKSKGISGQKKRIPPPTQQDSVPLLYNQAQKRYDCGGLLQQKDSWWSLSDGGQEIRYHKNTYEHLTNFSNLSYKRDKKQKQENDCALHIVLQSREENK